MRVYLSVRKASQWKNYKTWTGIERKREREKEKERRRERGEKALTRTQKSKTKNSLYQHFFFIPKRSNGNFKMLMNFGCAAVMLLGPLIMIDVLNNSSAWKLLATCTNIYVLTVHINCIHDKCIPYVRTDERMTMLHQLYSGKTWYRVDRLMVSIYSCLLFLINFD